MLTRLLVRQVLLVEESVLEFGSGFNVLTGETGAGKSILLHALGLLLGARGSPEWIRHPAGALLVEGVFRVPAASRLRLRARGIAADGDELVLTREIRRNGTNRCHVNGQRVLVEALRGIAEPLVEIHGQREEERFRRADAQRDAVDLFGEHAPLRRRVREAFREARRARERRDAHERQMAQLARDEEWIRFQLEEIERLRPTPGEDDALRERLADLRQSATRGQLLSLIEHILNGPEGGVLEGLEELDHRSAALEGGDPAWEDLRTGIRDLARRARRLHQDVRRLSVEAEGEGPALEELESRLSELEALRRKHRRSLEEIAALAEEMRASLDELGRAQQTAEALASASRAAEAALQTAAAELTRARKKAGIGLAAAVRGELDAIAMTDCRLRVGFAPAEEEGGIGPTGGERVVFEAETNPGEGYRPLGEIASGGEMSRIALALRVVLGRRGRRGLSVFDEVDAGLGGGAARAVAQRLRQVSRHRQVLLVTHMPIIAAQADRHLRVAKETQEGRARVTVAPLTGAARVAEIARMLSGSPRDPQAVEHARALLRGPLGLPEARGSARS